MLGVFFFFFQFVCFMISFCPVHNLNIVDNADLLMFSIQHLPPVRLILFMLNVHFITLNKVVFFIE